MKNRLLILLAVLATLPIELLVCLGQSDGGVSVGPGATTAQALFPMGSYTNGSQYVAEIHGFTWGVTNPVDVWGAYDHPTANGHYTYSLPDHGFTNINHVFLYFEANSFEYEIGFTNNDPDVQTNWYYYVGSNLFPTNSYGSWSDSAMTSVVEVNVGTAVSTNWIQSVTSRGISIQDPGSTSAQPILSLYDNYGNQLFREYEEDNTYNYWDNLFVAWRSTPFQKYTNLYDSAHNFAAGMSVMRLNGEATPVGGDSRGGLILMTVFGTNVIVNGANDPSHIADLGGSIELLSRRNIRYSTSTQSGTFMHPWKCFGDGSIWQGNNPESEHAIYPFGPGAGVSPGWNIFRGSADRPNLLIEKDPNYTGALTNGGIFSDGLDVFLIAHGGKGAILTSNTPTMIGGTNQGVFTTAGGLTVSSNASSTIFMWTNIAAYTLPAGYCGFWVSNRDLYYVTQLKTNLITLGH